MRTALVLSYSQITEGNATCGYCGAAATVTLATGADPKSDPLCWKHASAMIEASLGVGERLFGVAA